MATIAIIQARMSSTRLPGKILLDIAPGKTILACMLERVAASKEIDKTVIERDAVAGFKVFQHVAVVDGNHALVFSIL